MSDDKRERWEWIRDEVIATTGPLDPMLGPRGVSDAELMRLGELAKRIAALEEREAELETQRETCYEAAVKYQQHLAGLKEQLAGKTGSCIECERREQRIAKLTTALHDQWNRWNSMNSSRVAKDGGDVVRKAMHAVKEALGDDE